MITVKRTWETAFFTASNRQHDSVTVEMTIDHKTRQFAICTGNNEMVSFSGDSVKEAYLRVKALKAAVDYANESINRKSSF